jgi:hypothetical protein
VEAQLRYFVGLDLGQAQDPTALAVLERPKLTAQTPPWQRRPAYAVRDLRWPHLGTPYPEVARLVARLVRTGPLLGCMLVVDQTGVGRAVVDLLDEELRKAPSCLRLAVTITAGTAVRAGANDSVHVPKGELIGQLQALMQARRLRVARGLPEAETLVRELENYWVKLTASANEVSFSPPLPRSLAR